MSAPFVVTKFGREYDAPRQQFCDEDCAEFLSGTRFDPQIQVRTRDESDQLRVMREALQKAWIILDGLRSYRDDAELLAILRSWQMEDAREAVRQSGMISIGNKP